ncbi:MAG: hypothetical protein NT034_02875, partial [Candidatus Magasanikbacteria bacterium]|nr:hypothetical protein [Candidatus Magasanikbacteria bacterium]
MKKIFFQNKKSALGFITVISLVAFSAYHLPEKWQLANFINPSVETQFIASKNTTETNQNPANQDIVNQDAMNRGLIYKTPTGVLGETDTNQQQPVIGQNLKNQFIQIKGNLGTLGEIIQKDGRFYLVKNVIENGNIKRHTIKAINLDTGAVTSRIIANNSIASEDLKHNLTIQNLTIDGDFIVSNYTGQSSITTLGTITNGTWQGSLINSNYLGSNVMLEGENISLLTNNAGYITASSTEILSNKSGNISMWTNNANYLTGTKVDSFNTRTGVVTLSGTDVTSALTFTPYNATNPSGFITASSSDALINKSGSNLMWTNNAGYITAISSDVLTNKTWNGNTIGLAYGGTGTANGSITSTGALNFSAGGTNQNVTLTPSGSGYTILNGNVGIGTTAPGYKLHLVSTATLESPALGTELTDSTGWTSTNWTGSYGAGFTHTTGNTSTLSRAVTITASTAYEITFTISGRTTGQVEVLLGGAVSTGGSGHRYPDVGDGVVPTTTYTYGPTTVDNSSSLTFNPTSTFNGTISNISVKRITAAYNPTFVLTNSAGNNVLEMRSISSNSGSMFIGTNAGQFSTPNNGSLTNTGIGFNAMYRNTSGSQNTAVGSSALVNNTNGAGVTAIGMNALANNVTGDQNTGVGTGVM